MAHVSVVIPVLNEEESLPELLDHLSSCTPPPFEIVVSDGGSTDGTVGIAKNAKTKVVAAAKTGPGSTTKTYQSQSQSQSSRALSLNRGLAAATGQLVVFVHADTLPPKDFVTQIQDTMADGKISLGAFRAILVSEHDGGRRKVNRVLTEHHFIKTYYAPFLLYPFRAMRGLRAFFGDQCMFGRRQQLLEVGGFDEVPIMEESSLCLKMLRFGPQKQIRAACTTLDRRIALYGTMRVTLLFWFIGFGSQLGIPLSWLRTLYPPQHELEEHRRLSKLRKQLCGNTSYETNFLWKEVVRDKCYDHPKLSLPATGGTVVDVGANIGVASLWFANCKLKGATIHAIEPSPRTFRHLQANSTLGTVRGNHVVTHPLAMSRAAVGSLPLTMYPNCSGWNSFHKDETSLRSDLWQYVSNLVRSKIGPFATLVLPIAHAVVYPFAFSFLTAGAVKLNVQVTNLSSFMAKHTIASIDLLKIDVERHEYQVLLGIADPDWSKIQAVVIETEVQHTAIRQLLERHGFQVEEKFDPLLSGAPHSIIWGLRTKL